MKAKRSILNLSFGLGSQLITIILGFFIPRLIMVNYGSEANGLIASIVQIISYLALLEAGVGAASIQALYKPQTLRIIKTISTLFWLPPPAIIKKQVFTISSPYCYSPSCTR